MIPCLYVHIKHSYCMHHSHSMRPLLHRVHKGCKLGAFQPALGGEAHAKRGSALWSDRCVNNIIRSAARACTQSCECSSVCLFGQPFYCPRCQSSHRPLSCRCLLWARRYLRSILIIRWYYNCLNRSCLTHMITVRYWLHRFSLRQLFWRVDTQLTTTKRSRHRYGEVHTVWP